ncbi:MAG TPA: M20/M25/M40 family metallo-hydrolase [Polyangiaceae bacterium]|nr:M20/M25/M40 family metallo-hydrolase [Polyangiaceae bacterium]
MSESSLDPIVNFATATEEALIHFKALLRIDTTNPPGNERPAAEYIVGVLEREGIACKLVESRPGRASVVARLTSSGQKGPLLLNGHLDVVPVERSEWKYDPFSGEEAEGCIWGRGAIDMKNMVAMSLMTLVLLKRQGIPLERDVIFAAVADEEAGSLHGSVYLVEQHPELVRAEYVLNEVGGHTLHMGSSRFYPIQVAEKGICWFEITAHGPPGHGSMPRPGTAVARLARALVALSDTRLPQHQVKVVENFIRALAEHAPFPQGSALKLLLNPRWAAQLLGLIRRQNPEQAIALDALLRNTVSPTVLVAGQKVNVIPSRAKAQVDGRILPGQSVERFLEEVREVVGDDVDINVLLHHDPVTFDADTPLFDTIARTLAVHDPGAVPVPYMIPGFTDAFAYARLGAVCYGFAPVRLGPDLNFSQMYHGHNERIPRDGFAWGLRVLYDVVRDFCRARVEST